MPYPSTVVQQCPTRLDGHAPLIAHAIPGVVCDRRQASRYHKCSSCALAKVNEGKPRTPERELMPPPLAPAKKMGKPAAVTQTA